MTTREVRFCLKRCISRAAKPPQADRAVAAMRTVTRDNRTQDYRRLCPTAHEKPLAATLCMHNAIRSTRCASRYTTAREAEDLA